MKKEFGFILFDNINEFEKYLNNEKVTRKISRLQVHHMSLPNYHTWDTTDKKIYKNNRELGRTKALDDFGKNKWRYKDCNNHYIAQHFNIFPNGKITTGRSLNSKPIGITGWNDYAICVEIYGDFDKDIMTSSQRESVIALYALLCKKFNLKPSTNTIRAHCWFTSGGTYLGDYYKNKSAKTCPGTNFMNFGNSRLAFINNFYPLIEKYLANHNTNKDTAKNIKLVKNISKEKLNIRSSPNWNGKIIATLNPGDSLTYISGPLSAKGSTTKMYKCKNNSYITASSKYTKIITKK